MGQLVVAVGIMIGALFCCTSCGHGPGDPQLTSNTYLELVDWHISGLWVINCPVAWFRVANYNQVPITNITLEYQTYDFDGKLLNTDKFTIVDSGGTPAVVRPGEVKNFIEQYLGLVHLHSDKLSVKLVSVSHGS